MSLCCSQDQKTGHPCPERLNPRAGRPIAIGRQRLEPGRSIAIGHPNVQQVRLSRRFAAAGRRLEWVAAKERLEQEPAQAELLEDCLERPRKSFPGPEQRLRWPTILPARASQSSHIFSWQCALSSSRKQVVSARFPILHRRLALGCSANSRKNFVRKIAQSNLSLYTLLGSTEFATNLDTFDPLVCLLDPGRRIS